MTFKYSLIVDEEGSSTLTFYINGEHHVITQDHPNFARIVQAVQNGEDPTEFIDLGSKITSIDSRVTIAYDTVYFDGEPVHNLLTQTILRFSREGRDSNGLVRFLENLMQNPSRRARDQLFEWLERQGLTVTPDGHFVGYKGVNADGTSVTAGPGIVNGEKMNGHLPNDVGNVISMERSAVMDDPDIDCSHGLHVGAHSYANNFGSRLLVVKVNPRDVVSVPRHDTSKLRCCRYEVMEIHPTRENDVSWYEDEAGEGWDYEDDNFDSLEDKIPQNFLTKLRARFGK